MKANEVKILSGNKQVAQAVSSGEIDFGITDTDDAYEEIQAGRPVEIIYPDQGEGQIGTLYIPNTLAVIKGSPHAAEARRLVDYILSPEVEARLAQGPSAQVPLNPDVTVQPPIKTPRTVRAMQVDFEKAAAEVGRRGEVPPRAVCAVTVLRRNLALNCHSITNLFRVGCPR